MEEESQRHGCFDGEVRVLQLGTSRARAIRFPRGDGRLGQPHGAIASTDQGSVVGRPVSDAVLRLVRRIDSRLHPTSLVWSSNATLYSCNNARSRIRLARKCYLCPRNNLSPMCPEWTLKTWRRTDRDQTAVICCTTRPSIYLPALNTTFIPTLPSVPPVLPGPAPRGCFHAWSSDRAQPQSP